MKKNILKYGLVLFTVFFYCASGYAQSPPVGPYNYPPCDGLSGDRILIAGGDPVDAPDGNIETIYVTDMAGTWCWATGDKADCGLDHPCYIATGLPLGSSFFIFMLLVTGYGVFVYYRRRSAQAV